MSLFERKRTQNERGRNAAFVLVLAAKAELLGTLDAMLSEEWETAHPVKAAERRWFDEGVLAESKTRL